MSLSLAYFTIFNPALGPDEESLPNQILFYTSATTSDLDSQLRNIGLVQGILELGKSFSKQDAEPINFIKSRDTRSYLLELEPGFWSVLCLDIVLENGSRDLTIPATRQILSQIRNAYDHFSLEHNTLDYLLNREGRDRAIRVIESWWMRWFWSWRPDGADATLLFDGFVRKRAYMSETNKQQLTSWYSDLNSEVTVATVDVLYKGEYVWSSDYSPDSIIAKRRLQRYVLEYLSSPKATAPHIISTTPEVGDSETQGASLVRSMDSWLNPKKWSMDTDQMLGLFRSSPQPVAIVSDSRTLEGSFTFGEARRLFLSIGQEDCEQEIYLNLFHFEGMDFVICLATDDTGQWTRICEFLNRSLPELSQVITPPEKSHRIPYFFSLLYDQETGSIYSTLPGLLQALQESENDSPAQVQVKRNTIYLHHQIYQLYSRGSREAVVKTGRGIWIMIRTDDLGSVVLCKSSRSGETMEEIEREGRRWIGKLRAVHLGHE